MDEQRARVNDDLRGVLGGDVLFEPLRRAPYAHDASLYEADPLGVVVPGRVEDVVNTLRYAAENGIPVHPRGAASGVSGGAIGPGLVVDLSRHFRRVVEIQADRVVVQAGVVLGELNARLAPLGRRVGVDPPGAGVATVGGMIGVDAVGPSSIRHGSFGDAVERLRVVFANGETAELGRELWPTFDEEGIDYKGVVLRKLGVLVRRHQDLLTRDPRVGRSGYALAKAATGVGVHLPRLLSGAYGTLGVVTEATIKTVPVAAAQVAVLLPFARLVDAASASAGVPGPGSSLSACELFDWRLIRLAREANPKFRDWIDDTAEAVLIALFEGDDPAEVSARGSAFAAKVSRGGRLSADPVTVNRRADCDLMIGLRAAVEPLLMRLGGNARPTTLFEEVSVPPERLAELIQRLQVLMRDENVSWVVDAHAAQGRLHPRPFLDLSDPSDGSRLHDLAAAVQEAVMDLGGTAGGGGLVNPLGTPFARKQFGDLLPVYREVKLAFDPMNLLNPGAIVGDEGSPSARRLRLPSGEPPIEDLFPAGNGSGEVSTPSTWDLPTLSGSGEVAAGPIFLPVLRWQGAGPVATSSACNGCGTCRGADPSMRMCPTFRALRSEEATPRAKANLIRQIANGDLDPKLWGSEEFKRHADLCVHCNLCATECPSGVDVSSLMLEAKAAYVENHGLSPSEWAASRVEVWGGLASRFPILANATLGSRPGRWLLERLLGLSRLRRLPRAHRWSFTSRAARLGLTRPRPQEPGPRVAYFVDTYANHFDQELAESVVAVLRHAGVNVYVPARQRDSGMAALVAGDVEHSRDLALANLRVLGDAVRDGYTVVCSEPTAALMIRQEYLKLTDDLDAALVAENTLDIGQYLTGLADRGAFPEPQPLKGRVGYHQPCHLRALDIGTPGLDLIRRIPELNVEYIDRGCSGMAGTFGLQRDNFRTSLRAGRGLLSRLRDDDIELGASECSACRLQMQQGSKKRTLHPIKLLCMSYGLSPSLRRRWKDRKVSAIDPS